MLIDSDDIIIYYPKILIYIPSVSSMTSALRRVKLHWWAANQNLLFGFYISPTIWQR